MHARNKFPDCGIVLVGDFNNLDISDLLTGHDLNQIICEPTRGSAVSSNYELAAVLQKAFNSCTRGYI